MQFFKTGISFLAVISLGISGGASLAEVMTLVPFWQKLQPADFYHWYIDNKATLVAFYSPLQIYSTILGSGAAIIYFISKDKRRLFMAVAALFACAVLFTFLLYFKAANAHLAATPMQQNELAQALSSWASWQWLRISLGTAAFAFALTAVMKK